MGDGGRMQVCNYASMWQCENAGIQVCGNLRIQLCEYAGVWRYEEASMQVWQCNNENI